MIQPKYYEDYQVGVVRESPGRTITETDIVLHAGRSRDFCPHHVDAEWCRKQEFKERIAHGTLVFTIAVGLTAGEVNPEAFTCGYDRLRFVKPIFIGDTLQARVLLKEKRDSSKRPDYGLVVELVEAFNQRKETVRPANTCSWSRNDRLADPPPNSLAPLGTPAYVQYARSLSKTASHRKRRTGRQWAESAGCLQRRYRSMPIRFPPGEL